MVEPEQLQTYFSSLFEESDDRRGVPAADRSVQRTHPAAVHVLDRCAVIYQVLNLRRERFCPSESNTFVLLLIHPQARALANSSRRAVATHHFGVAAEGGQVQRRASTAVGVSGGGAPLHQLPNQLELSFQARPAQRCQALAVSLLQRGTWQQRQFRPHNSQLLENKLSRF